MDRGKGGEVPWRCLELTLSGPLAGPKVLRLSCSA